MAQRRTTIADVARAAGVSKGAVSFALNDRPGVARSTRDRILAVADELGWTPSHRARALSVVAGAGRRTGDRPAAGDARRRPVLPRLHRRHRDDAVRARPGAAAAGRARPGAPSGRATAASPPDGRVDGVFLTDLRVDDPRPALLAELGLPGGDRSARPDRAPAGPCVAVDDRPGIAAAVEHLVELGPPAHRPRRRPDGRSCTAARASAAWADALAAAGLPPSRPCVRSDFSAAGRGRRHRSAARPAPSRRPRSSTPTT